MWSKKIKGKKLAVQILEYLLISVLVSGFVFCFLYYLSGTLAENYFVYRGMELTRVQERVLAVWRSSICAFGALAVFVVLFLFILGQRLSYLIRIIRGVERLREQEETEGKDGKTAPAEIPLEGNDELAELAGAINYLSAARRELDMRERRMQEEKEAWIPVFVPRYPHASYFYAFLFGAGPFQRGDRPGGTFPGACADP